MLSRLNSLTSDCPYVCPSISDLSVNTLMAEPFDFWHDSRPWPWLGWVKVVGQRSRSNDKKMCFDLTKILPCFKVKVKDRGSLLGFKVKGQGQISGAQWSRFAECRKESLSVHGVCLCLFLSVCRIIMRTRLIGFEFEWMVHYCPDDCMVINVFFSTGRTYTCIQLCQSTNMTQHGISSTCICCMQLLVPVYWVRRYNGDRRTEHIILWG